ncbi:hypothetical protein RB213_007385 [Colletotrichum asianum]
MFRLAVWTTGLRRQADLEQPTAMWPRTWCNSMRHLVLYAANRYKALGSVLVYRCQRPGV